MTDFAEKLRSEFDAEKAKHTHRTIVGFLMGSFYEFFFEDAAKVAETLGIVLTKRAKSVPMSGISVGRMEVYLPRLQAAGHEVVLVDATYRDLGDVLPIDPARLVEAEREARRRVIEHTEALIRLDRACHAILADAISKEAADCLTCGSPRSAALSANEIRAMSAVCAILPADKLLAISEVRRAQSHAWLWPEDAAAKMRSELT